MTADSMTSRYLDLIDCEGDEEFKSGKENYNDVWFNYLKENKAACFDHNYDFNFQGNDGTE